VLYKSYFVEKYQDNKLPREYIFIIGHTYLSLIFLAFIVAINPIIQRYAMKKFSIKALSVATMLCAMMPMAHADDDTGFYLGAGWARTDVNDNNFDESIDQLGLRAGYMFTDNFGIDLTSVVQGDTKTDNIAVEESALALSGIASLPLGEYFDLYGKLGVGRVKARLFTDNDVFTDDSSTELFWGIGGEVDFGVTNIFLEYNRIDTDIVDINFAMLGLKFEF
jgi:opacity protein-like surface antigen